MADSSNKKTTSAASQESAVNVMKNWAALVDKEVHVANTWNLNWGTVFNPNGVPTTDQRISELSKKKLELEAKIEKLANKDKTLETFISPHTVVKCRDLKPSFPFGG